MSVQTDYKNVSNWFSAKLFRTQRNALDFFGNLICSVQDIANGFYADDMATYQVFETAFARPMAFDNMLNELHGTLFA